MKKLRLKEFQLNKKLTNKPKTYNSNRILILMPEQYSLKENHCCEYLTGPWGTCLKSRFLGPTSDPPHVGSGGGVWCPSGTCILNTLPGWIWSVADHLFEIHWRKAMTYKFKKVKSTVNCTVIFLSTKWSYNTIREKW